MSRCTGRFLDGRSAASRDVEVTVGPTGLAIEHEGVPLDLWPWPALTADAAPTPAETRLGCDGRAAARLVVRDAGFAALVRERAPHLARVRGHGHGGARAAVLYGLLTVAALAAIYLGVTHGAALIARLVPEDMERRWGAAYADAFTADEGACDATAGRQALDRLVARLTAAGDLPPMTVRVVDIPLVNAFALPGGQVVVFRGLIDKAASGDEVAGVLSHEIGHVVERHALRRLIEHVGLAGAVGMVFGGAAWQQDDMVTQLLDLSYSRAMETEADRFAVELLRAADIRRAGMVSFFRRLAETGGDMPLSLLSTHPAADQRAAQIDASGGGGPAMSDADWQALQAICGPAK